MKNPNKAQGQPSPTPSSRLSSTEWEALLARIQSPSKVLEAHLAKSKSNLIDALSGLEDLERLTEFHLAPPAPALPPAPVAAQQATGFQQLAGTAKGSQPQGQSQTTPVQYQTSHEEYAPALNQSALVEALLQYQRKKSIRSSKSAPQAKAGPQGPSTGSSKVIDTPAFSRADFAPMRIPSIEAEPKDSPLGRAASPSVRLPVLRLKSENNSGNSPNNFPNNFDDDEQS